MCVWAALTVAEKAKQVFSAEAGLYVVRRHWLGGLFEIRFLMFALSVGLLLALVDFKDAAVARDTALCRHGELRRPTHGITYLL